MIWVQCSKLSNSKLFNEFYLFASCLHCIVCVQLLLSVNLIVTITFPVCLFKFEHKSSYPRLARLNTWVSVFALYPFQHFTSNNFMHFCKLSSVIFNHFDENKFNKIFSCMTIEQIPFLYQ